MTNTHNTPTERDIRERALALIEDELETLGIEDKEVEEALYYMLIDKALEWVKSDYSSPYESLLEDYFRNGADVDDSQSLVALNFVIAADDEN